MRTISDNYLIALTDSYKVGHWSQYPPGTEELFSFFESRGGVSPEVVFFGLQYYLKKYLVGSVVREEHIEDFKALSALHFGNASVFNENGWKRILKKHGGMLPIEIRAVPEGSIVPISNVLFTVESTDDQVPWLGGYVESLLSKVWYPSSVATRGLLFKRLLSQGFEDTGTLANLPFALHDFGDRGGTSPESAAIGGMAHLVNFRGTDTIHALLKACSVYNEPMAGFSVIAAEHSTITSWGEVGELDVYKHILRNAPSDVIVSIVIDSYDVFRAASWFCNDEELRDLVLNRQAKTVLRLDSGDPKEVILKVLRILADGFGFTTNCRMYKVLNSKVGILQGDGVEYQTMEDILRCMKAERWSLDNIVFGSGGGLVQKDLNRDTHKFACKCSSVTVNGEQYDVFKSPVTDPGKKSKKGKLALIRDTEGVYKTVSNSDGSFDDQNLLLPVFRNGEILKDYSLAEVRGNVLNHDSPEYRD